jgi:hypothetical protein
MTESHPRIETHPVSVNVPTYAASRGLPTLWPDDYKLVVKIHGSTVYIAGDAEGLRGLAVQLLALANENVTPGYGTDLLANGIELDAGSAPVSIFRS